MHLPTLIQDLAVILAVGSVVTLIFRRIRQPVVLGYVVAGYLVGPHFYWMPTVTDTESVKVWAEIGVIFLLFGLGLEFSFKKLFRVGSAAGIAAIFEVSGMMALGFITGKLFGWTTIDSLFLGGIISISSTSIIIRALDELKMKTRGFVNLVFGILVVEDLVAIVLMVLLSTLAVGKAFSGMETALSITKLFFFLVLWFISGIFLLPTFLRRTRHLMSDETLLIVSLGLCLVMVVLATKAGFSPALGAFIMGSILAETTVGEKIEELVTSVRDLFAAVFFISVGILIQPQILVDYAIPVVVITMVILCGKVLFVSSGALLAGRSLRHSLQTGMSLAQIGEFSFIIAGLGLSLKVTSEFLYPVAIGVSAITTFTTPYFIKSADALVERVQRILPAATVKVIEQLSNQAQRRSIASVSQQLFFKVLIKIATNMVVIVAIFLATTHYFHPLFLNHFTNPDMADLAALLLSLFAAAPFLWALAFSRLGSDLDPSRHDRLYYIQFVVLQLARRLSAIFAIGLLASQIVSAVTTILLITAFVFVLGFIWSRQLSQIYKRLEDSFIQNLHERELTTKARELPPLAPWDAHLLQLEVAPESPIVGKTLSETMVRERFGITIALIERGQLVIAAPSRNTVIYPGDVLHVIGTDEQISGFKMVCEEVPNGIRELQDFDYVLVPMTVAADSIYVGKTILDSGIREASQGLVVGVEKQGVRHLNPDSAMRIEAGDVLWIVGDRNLTSVI